ncbi:MAG TPA: PIN domain-containing protein [Candidatus Dormibacteraeota bacterium]|jgi:PIN domain nuclease of toxin-antitoxin system|nr:PIN domain-containing protein [Candidatus Dormibacteraeota bacterium]
MDASAAVAWLNKERGADTVGKLLPHAVIPASALTEALYRSREKGHKLSTDDLATSLKEMGASIEPFTDADVVCAADLIFDSRQARTQPQDPCLSLGDALCLAVADRLGLPVTGSDHYWETLRPRIQYHPFR